jgi:glycosyltransferase 2 family protein
MPLSRLLQTRAGRLARYGVSIGLVTAFVLLIDWTELGRLRGQFRWGPVFWGVILAGATYPLHAWRWLLLYRAQGLALPWRWAHRVTWIGNFYNSLLLGGLGGDAARVFYVCRDAPEQRLGGLASLVMDRVMGLMVLFVLALVGIGAKLGEVLAHPELRLLGAATALAFAAGLVAGIMLLRTAPESWPAPLQRAIGETRVRSLSGLLANLRGSPRAHAWAFALSALIWVMDFVSVWLLAAGLGLDLPFVETCLAVCVAYVATALPISVGGHGVREGALLFTLGLFGLVSASGAERESALLLAVLVWAETMLWSLFGGLYLLSPARSGKPGSR